MVSPFRELKNASNISGSSYETAWSTSFDKRKSANSSENSVINRVVKNEPISDNEDDKDVSTLENDISMMSVSSPKTSGTPNRNYFTPSKAATPGSKLIQKLKSDGEKQLLRNLYPELFQDDEEPENEPEKSIKNENTSEEDDDMKENIPPTSQHVLLKETKTERKRVVIDSESDDDDAFEEYLRKLREENGKKVEVNKPKRSPNERFVVDDDEEVSEQSISEADLSDEQSYSESGASYSSRDSPIEKADKASKSSWKQPSDEDEYFLESLSIKYSKYRHKDSENFVKDGSMRQKKHREALADRLLEIFKRRCFAEIPDSMLKLIWNPRLRKSAGQCRNHSNGNSTIEMSNVVCTTAERIRDTLVHELCHAAVWIVDKLHKEGHGPGWKKWAVRCMRTFRCLPVIERCHNYEIEAKFLYVCQNESCQQTIKRQSKSLDIEKKICGRCQTRFSLYRFDRRTNTRILVTASSNTVSGAEEASTAPKTNKFAIFVKQNYGKYKQNGIKHTDIMERLSEDYKQTKNESVLKTIN